MRVLTLSRPTKPKNGNHTSAVKMNSVLWVMGFNMIQWFNAFCLLRLLNSVGHCAVDSGMRFDDAANELWLEKWVWCCCHERRVWGMSGPQDIHGDVFVQRYTRLCEIWVWQLTKLQNRKPLLFCHCIRFQEPPQEANAALLSAAVAQHRKQSSCWETQNNPTWQGPFVDSKQLWTLVGCPEPSRNFRFQVFFPIATTNRGFRCFFPAPEAFGHWLPHLSGAYGKTSPLTPLHLPWRSAKKEGSWKPKLLE